MFPHRSIFLLKISSQQKNIYLPRSIRRSMYWNSVKEYLIPI